MSITNDNCGFDDGLWLFAILALMGFGGNGMFGNGNRVGEAYATQADIQRAVDLNSIQKGQSEIERAITSATSGIVGAVKDGNYNMLGEIRDIQTEVNRGFTNMQTCCCDIKQGIMENQRFAGIICYLVPALPAPGMLLGLLHVAGIRRRIALSCCHGTSLPMSDWQTLLDA